MREGIERLLPLVGFVGYATLSMLGWAGHRRTFAAGVSAGCGVHLLLLATMMLRGTLCPICVLAVLVSAGLFGITSASGLTSRRSMAVALIGGILLSMAVGKWRESTIRNPETAPWQKPARATAEGNQFPSQGSLTIRVFEQPDCGYCSDFRNLQLPLLKSDFGGKIQVQFDDALTAGWISRTPTIVVDGGAVFEGLPASYADLRLAIERALARRK